jgi:hypothetical protein
MASVYDPTAPSSTERRAQRHPLDGLAGKVIGFIDNTKPNFNHLVDELGELLVSRYGVKAVVKRRKTNSGSAASGEIIHDIVDQCDAVVTGSGD